MNKPGFINVDNLSTCKRCGNSQLAWVKGKAGRWYLADAYKDEHRIVANKFQLHQCKEISSHIRCGGEVVEAWPDGPYVCAECGENINLDSQITSRYESAA